jgi:hypothetical protein
MNRNLPPTTFLVKMAGVGLRGAAVGVSDASILMTLSPRSPESALP